MIYDKIIKHDSSVKSNRTNCMHHTIVFSTTNNKKENKVSMVEVIKYFHLVERHRSYLLSDFKIKFEKRFARFQKVRFGK